MSERGFDIRKIDPASEQYRDIRRFDTMLSSNMPTEATFGGELVNVDPLKILPDYEAKKIKEERLKNKDFQDKLSRLRNDFINLNSNKGLSEELGYLVFKARKNPEINQRLNDITKVTHKENGEEDRYIELNEMSDNLFIQILEEHARLFEQENNEFRELAPKIVDEFIKDLNKFLIENGISIDQGQLIQKLLETSIHLADPLQSYLEEKWGSYDSKTGVILISSSTPKNQLVQTLYHELLHAISGRTFVVVEPTNTQNSNPALNEHAHIRGGLAFGSKKGEIFKWLNEAITEQLSTVLVGNHAPASYTNEIQLLNLLMTKGKITLNPKDFYLAYFEDFHPNQKPGPIPHWKKLSELIADSYEPRFLVKLDFVIREKGVNTAIEMLSQNWKQIIEFKSEKQD